MHIDRAFQTKPNLAQQTGLKIPNEDFTDVIHMEIGDDVRGGDGGWQSGWHRVQLYNVHGGWQGGQTGADHLTYLVYHCTWRLGSVPMFFFGFQSLPFKISRPQNCCSSLDVGCFAKCTNIRNLEIWGTVGPRPAVGAGFTISVQCTLYMQTNTQYVYVFQKTQSNLIRKG